MGSSYVYYRKFYIAYSPVALPNSIEFAYVYVRFNNIRLTMGLVNESFKRANLIIHDYDVVGTFEEEDIAL